MNARTAGSMPRRVGNTAWISPGSVDHFGKTTRNKSAYSSSAQIISGRSASARPSAPPASAQRPIEVHMRQQQIGPQLHRQLPDAEQAALRVQLFEVRRITRAKAVVRDAQRVLHGGALGFQFDRLTLDQAQCCELVFDFGECRQYGLLVADQRLIAA